MSRNRASLTVAPAFALSHVATHNAMDYIASSHDHPLTHVGLANAKIRKVWVSIKFLSAKFGFTTPPPQKKGPKMKKNCTNQKKILKIDTFLGGGGEHNFMDKTILWTSGRF